jgi:hypothetical protein
MKKILRLVTTSVLTLTLVACGEASSSVSTSGTQTSSSVSSTTSAFANVSTITLTAASDTLTQVMGTQKAVVVQAALNANTNPSLALEWFVNGTKSNQTGRVFEYTPAAAGTFVITARSGSVTSNALTLTVGTASLAITGEVKVVDADTIEITAPGGATVAVTNNEVLATSMYDLARGVYVINLKTPFVQGVSSTVTLTREGSQAVSRVFTFDTRKVEINTLTGTGVTDNKDGTYSINRPHSIVAGANGGDNLTVNSYQVTFKATNLKNTSVAFSLERLSAPTGAAAFTNQSGFINVAGDTDSASGSFDFNLNKSTVAGDYVYRYTLGTKTVQFTVKVLVPEMAVELDTYDETDGLGTVYLSTTGAQITAATFKYDLKYQQKWPDNASGTHDRVYLVPKNADGSYDIVKDFLEDSEPTTAQKEIQKVVEFRYFGEFFDVPSTLVAQTSIEPNQVMVNLVGPGGVAFMRVQPSLTQDVAFQTPATFRADFANRTVTQRIDSNTVVGTYTYTIRVMQSGVEIYKTNVVINVKAPEAKLDFTATQLDAGDYLIAHNQHKQNFDSKVSVYLTTSTEAVSGAGVAAELASVKKLFNNNAMSRYPVSLNSYSEEQYLAKRKEWVDAYIAAYPLPAWTASMTLAQWHAGLLNLNKSLSPTAAQINALIATDLANETKYNALIKEYVGLYNASVFSGSTALINALVYDAAGTADVDPADAAAFTNISNLYRQGIEALYPPLLTFKGIDSSVYQNQFVSAVNAYSVSVSGFLGVNDTEKADIKALIDNFQRSSILPTVNPSQALTEAQHTTALGNFWTNYTGTGAGQLNRAFPAFSGWATATTGTLAVFYHSHVPVLGQLNEFLATDVNEAARQTLAENYAKELLDDLITATTALTAGEKTTLRTALVTGTVPASSGDRDAAALLYKEMIESFYPPYTASNKSLAEEKDTIIYVVEKPRATGLDAKVVAFDLKLSNLQSESNPLAALTDAFTSPKSSLKTQFLTYVESSVGPGEIRNNNALNTKNTKVAVELGFANGSNVADILTQNLADTTTKYAYYASTTDSITLRDIFTFDVDFLTVSGNYTFTVRVGSLEKSVIVQVKDPVVKLNFGVATGGDFVKNATDGKFYFTQETVSDTTSATFTFEALNLAASATAAYTVVRVDEKGNRIETSNTLATTAKPGNDGHVLSPGLLEVVANVSAAAAPTVSLSAPGTYTYTITLGGVTETVTLVFEKYPSLTVEKAFIGTSQLTAYDGGFIYSSAALSTKFEFDVKAVSLGTAVTYYSFDTGTITSNGTAAGADITSLTGATLAAKATNASLKTITFVDGIGRIDHTFTTPALPSVVAGNTLTTPAADVGVTGTVLFVNLYQYKASTDDFIFVGHARVILVNTNIAA